MKMFGSFGFFLWLLALVRFCQCKPREQGKHQKRSYWLTPWERVNFVYTSVFTHMLLLSISLCHTYSTHPHTHAQTAVIVGSGGILEGSSFCVLITAGGIAYTVADSQLQAPQCCPEPGFPSSFVHGGSLQFTTVSFSLTKMHWCVDWLC